MVGLLMMSFAGSIGRFFNNPDLAGYVGLLALFLGLSVITRPWEAQLVAERRVSFASAVIFGFEVLKCSLMVVALYASTGIRPLLWALVMASLLKAVAYLVFLGSDFRWFAAAGPPRQAFAQFPYAMALWFPGIFALLSFQAHQYIVGFYYKPADYAVYAVACFQVPFIGMLATSIAEVFLVRATEYRSRDDHGELYRLWINVSRKSMMLFVPIAICLAVLARPIITLLFTTRYQASAPLFAIIVLALILNGLFQDAFFRACEAMKTYSFFHISRGVLGVLLGVVAVRFWGVWGAAVSLLLTLAIINGWQLVEVAKILGVPFAQALPWKDISKIGLASITAAILVRVSVQPISSAALGLAVGLMLFGVVYLLMVMALGLLRVDEALSLIRNTKAEFSQIVPLRTKAH
jgi:O-antigen/teichoic acid export membrane protein